jgi:tetratricopeptide (TPR) repeat protein
VSVNAQSSQEPQGVDDQAYALMQLAARLAPEGRWEAAAEALEQAAKLHAQAKRGYDEARCLQLAATMHRSVGHLSKARPLSARATALAHPDRQLAVSIAAEQAEIAFAESRYQDALSEWSTAIQAAHQAGLKAEGMSAMLRRRAAAAMALGQINRANDDFEKAYRLVDATQGRVTASFVRLEQAALLWEYDHPDTAEQVLTGVEAGLADSQASPHLLAELFVARARLARTTNLIDAAVKYAERSRAAALEAVAPLSYFAASVELAEALQSKDSRIDAYSTLATAWATLSDLMGKEVAGSWVEPCLLAYKLRWGTPAFEQAKKEYEARRRANRT